MTISRVRRKKVLGKSLGIEFIFCSNKLLSTCRPVGVSMLVYIDDASAVKSLAPGGSIMGFNSFNSSVEFFI